MTQPMCMQPDHDEVRPKRNAERQVVLKVEELVRDGRQLDEHGAKERHGIWYWAVTAARWLSRSGTGMPRGR